MGLCDEQQLSPIGLDDFPAPRDIERQPELSIFARLGSVQYMNGFREKGFFIWSEGSAEQEVGERIEALA